MYETYSTGIKNANESVFIQRHSCQCFNPRNICLGIYRRPIHCCPGNRKHRRGIGLLVRGCDMHNFSAGNEFKLTANPAVKQRSWIYQINVHGVKIHPLIDVFQTILRWHHHILHYWLLIILQESWTSTTEEHTQMPISTCAPLDDDYWLT